jgi:hypothetical protein
MALITETQFAFLYVCTFSGQWGGAVGGGCRGSNTLKSPEKATGKSFYFPGTYHLPDFFSICFSYWRPAQFCLFFLSCPHQSGAQTGDSNLFMVMHF